MNPRFQSRNTGIRGVERRREVGVEREEGRKLEKRGWKIRRKRIGKGGGRGEFDKVWERKKGKNREDWKTRKA